MLLEGKERVKREFYRNTDDAKKREKVEITKEREREGEESKEKGKEKERKT